MPLPLPSWAQEMRAIYRSGSISQFILYGNIFDLVAAPPVAVPASAPAGTPAATPGSSASSSSSSAGRSPSAATIPNPMAVAAALGAGVPTPEEQALAAFLGTAGSSTPTTPAGPRPAGLPVAEPTMGPAGPGDDGHGRRPTVPPPPAATSTSAAANATADAAAGPASGGVAHVPLRDFLVHTQLAPFDLVVSYDRSRGLRALRDERNFFQGFLSTYDSFHRTKFAANPAAVHGDPNRPLELVDRLLDYTLKLKALDESKAPRLAILIEHAQFLVPRAEPAYIRPDTADSLLRMLDWATNPAVVSAYVTTVLLTENLNDLHPMLTECPHNGKIRLDLPEAAAVRSYVETLTRDIPDFLNFCAVDRVTLAHKLEGLSLVDLRQLIQRAVKNDEKITLDYLKSVKKSLIEKSAGGRISFIESGRTLDDVAGHTEAKFWLKQDVELMRRGRSSALPMGYLLNGRIGTGKTYLVECFAGECGVPCVEIKNFRDKWVGATESNLEAVFKILHALGQVIVFIDEADQMTGKRDSGSSDSGLSGRIYAMLAKEMADTRNRGRIFWIFATSRPDLLEVDLKRAGRLDVHIPLFPPQDDATRRDWLLALAKKNKVKLTLADIPPLPDDPNLGGNELEGIVIRANRLYETQPEGEARRPIQEVIAEVIREFRPMAMAERLEYMDLVATLECTDERFLPPRFRKMSREDLLTRIDELKARLGIHGGD